jgi:hydroxyethylthiazole kinase-like uncharacterized protein yjeF
MRAGAGKLRIATVESAAIQVGLAMPEAMVIGVAEAADGGFTEAAAKMLAEQLADVNAVVAGPGMKGNDSCRVLARTLLENAAALALDVALLKSLRSSDEKRRVTPVLLPDGDELASLLGCDEAEVERDPLGCGKRAAELYRSVVLVKGATSHVVTPGLGVSGSGDVLAGIVGGVLARGAEPLSALLWGVWLHGEAGAALAKKVGPIGFLARDIAGEVPALLPR